MYKSCTIISNLSFAYHAAKIRKISDNLYFFHYFLLIATFLPFFGKEKEKFSLFFSRFSVTLQEFSAFLYLKAVWEFKVNLGYELATVLNSTFFHLKVEVWLRILL